MKEEEGLSLIMKKKKLLMKTVEVNMIEEILNGIIKKKQKKSKIMKIMKIIKRKITKKMLF